MFTYYKLITTPLQVRRIKYSSTYTFSFNEFVLKQICSILVQFRDFHDNPFIVKERLMQRVRHNRLSLF